jgi:hypothetical protein
MYSASIGRFDILQINLCRVVHGDTPPPIGKPKGKKRQN